MADSEARQSCLEEWERKRQEGTLRQATAIGRLSSNSAVHLPIQKRKKPATWHV